MKKFVAMGALGLAVLSLASCGKNNDGGKIIEDGKVGVILPGTIGGETKSFQEHWNALAKEYGVTMVYEQFQGQDPTYYKTCAEKLVAAGCNAVICNFEMDGKESVLEYCVDSEIYVGYSGSTVSSETFDEYKDSPYFLGQIAPSPEQEQQQAYNMTKYFIDEYYKSDSVLPEGTTDTLAVWPADYHGLSLAHQMTYRWKGIKQALNEAGVTVNGDNESDSSKWTVTYTADSPLKDKVAIMGNNLANMNALITQCTGILMKNPCAVITTCNGNYLLNMFAQYGALSKATRFGTIDSFVSDYDKWYQADSTSKVNAFKVTHDPYLVGKFGAINEAILAVTAKAFSGEAIRDNGKALNINQTYWFATNKADFDKACNVSANFSYGKKAFDDIKTSDALQKLFDDSTLENLASKL